MDARTDVTTTVPEATMPEGERPWRLLRESLHQTGCLHRRRQLSLLIPAIWDHSWMPATLNYQLNYVDDLLVLGEKTTVDSTFEAIQKQVLLKHISYLEAGKPQQFLGRNIEHFGNYCTVGLQDSYINDMIKETSMNNCNAVATPGVIGNMHCSNLKQPNP